MWRLSHALRGTSTATSRPSPTTSYSPHPFSSSSPSSTTTATHHVRKRKTMEELWQDINLAALCGESRLPPPPSCQRHPLRSMILQDFLAGAFTSPRSTAASGELPLPPTALSLSRPPGGPSGSANFRCHASASAPLFSFAADQPLLNEQRGDRRHKRMMKNRESASRSRARKQAYTNELEMEVAHLAEENMKLKQHNEELRMAMAAAIPRKFVLQRTASSPF